MASFRFGLAALPENSGFGPLALRYHALADHHADELAVVPGGSWVTPDEAIAGWQLEDLRFEFL